MSDTYSVAISYGEVLGWIDYNGAARSARASLAAPHEVEMPHETLMDFTKETVTPLADRESFELALTRLWNETGVQVDWSRPVDYVKAHPHY